MAVVGMESIIHLVHFRCCDFHAILSFYSFMFSNKNTIIKELYLPSSLSIGQTGSLDFKCLLCLSVPVEIIKRKKYFEFLFFFMFDRIAFICL